MIEKIILAILIMFLFVLGSVPFILITFSVSKSLLESIGFAIIFVIFSSIYFYKAIEDIRKM